MDGFPILSLMLAVPAIAAVACLFLPAQTARVGAFGQPASAARAFRALADGLDVAIVRVVAARPGVEGALATVRACAPS